MLLQRPDDLAVEVIDGHRGPNRPKLRSMRMSVAHLSAQTVRDDYQLPRNLSTCGTFASQFDAGNP